MHFRNFIKHYFEGVHTAMAWEGSKCLIVYVNEGRLEVYIETTLAGLH